MSGDAPINIVYDEMGSVKDSGLTKRELFAAMAMVANRQAYPVESSGQVARNSIADADALLAELARGAERGK